MSFMDLTGDSWPDPSPSENSPIKSSITNPPSIPSTVPQTRQPLNTMKNGTRRKGVARQNVSEAEALDQAITTMDVDRLRTWVKTLVGTEPGVRRILSSRLLVKG